jgi:hypothetical protein
VRVQGDFAYVADHYSGLQVADISDPTSPTIVGNCESVNRTLNLEIDESYVYLADEPTGLVVMDVSDPMSPELISCVETPGSARDVDLVGNLALIADYNSGLQLIDVSDPYLPVIVGGKAVSSFCASVAVMDDYALVSDFWWGIQVVDITDPQTPSQIGGLTGGALTAGLKDIAVAGSMVYVADSDDGLLALDLSDPTSPELVGSINPLGGAVDAVQVSGGFAYLSAGMRVWVVDVTDPTDLAIVGQIPLSGTPRHTTVSAGMVYVGADYEGLQIIPAHCPTATAVEAVTVPVSFPRTLTALPNPAHDQTTLRLSGADHADAGLEIFDVTGRRVRRLFEFRTEGTFHLFTWDACDASGRQVPSGIYFARSSERGHSATTRLLIVR